MPSALARALGRALARPQPAHLRDFDPFVPAPSGEHMIALEPRILLDAAGGEGANDAFESRRPVIDLDGPADGSGLDSRSVEIDYPDGAVSVRLAEADAVVLDRTDDIVRLEITVTGDRAGAEDAVLIGRQIINMGRDGVFRDVEVGGSRVDVVYEAGSGTFTVTAAASAGTGAVIPKEDLTALVRGIEYGNLAIAPREADLVFTFHATDADNNVCDPVSSAVTVSSSGATPVAILDPDGSSSVDGRYRPTFTENGAPVPVADADVTIQDRDGSNIDEVIITLSNPQTGDALEVNLPDDLEGIGSFQEELPDGRLRVTLYSSSEATDNNYADIATALRSVTFTSTSERPDTTPRLVSVILIDDTGTQGTPTRLRIDVASVNDRPALDLDRSNRTDNGPDYRTQYRENAPGVAVISVGDNLLVDLDDSDLQEARAVIANPETGDRLFVAPGAPVPPDLAVTVAANGLSITIAGEGTPEEYSQALEALRFESQGETPVPGDRRVEMRVNDGRNNSNTGTAFVRVLAVNDPPEVIDPERPDDPDGPDDPDRVIPEQPGTDSVTLAALDTSRYFRDADGDTLAYAIADAPAWMAIDAVTGRITGTPPADGSQNGNTAEPGLYAVRVSASDGEAQASTTALFRIVNPAPVAADDRDTADDSGPPVTGSVLADNGAGADRDPDGDRLSIAAVNGEAAQVGETVAGSTGGTFRIAADGAYTFDPGTDFLFLRENETRATNVAYTLSDGEGGTDAAVLTVVVQGRNQGPDARDDRLGTDEDTPVTANLLADLGGGPDTDPENDPLVVDRVNGRPFAPGVPERLPSGAAVTLSEDGTVTYDPATAFQSLGADEVGADSFTYRITDPDGLASTATVRVAVAGRNDAPIPVDPRQPAVDPDAPDGPPTDPDDPRAPPADPNAYLPEQRWRDGDTMEPFTLTPWFGDPDANDAVTLTVGPGLPAGLSFDPATGTIGGTFAPDASQNGENGVYRVSVTATDPAGATFTTTLTFRVTNPAPQAADDRFETNGDEAVSGNALANDRDPDGDALRVATLEGGSAGRTVAGSNGGTFTLAPHGAVTFDPAGDFDRLRGDDTAETRATYTVTDGQGGTAQAEIVVTVTAGNAPPEQVAPADVQRGTDARPVALLDVAALVRDPDGDVLTFALAPGAPDWLAIDAQTGEITGTPPRDASVGGPDRDGRHPVAVRVSDGEHTLAVPVTWRIANPEPLAGDDRGRTDEGTPLDMSVRANDADPDGDPYRIAMVAGEPVAMGDAVTLASGATVTMVAPGQLRFDPAAMAVEGPNAQATFTYTIRDAQGAESTADVVVRVDALAPPLDPPFDDDRPVPPPIDVFVPGDPVVPRLFTGEPVLTAALEVIDPLAPRIDIDPSRPEPILVQANEMIRRLGGDVSLFGSPVLTEALDRVGDRDASDARWAALTGEAWRGNEFCAHMGPGHSALIRTHVRGDVVYLDLGTFGRERFASWRVEGSGHARVAMLDRNIAQIERPANATHEHLDIRATARDGTTYLVPLRVDLVSGEPRADGPIREDFAAARPTLREQVAALDAPARQLDAIFGPPLTKGRG